MKGHCIKSLKMLLSCGINDLHDDGFDGSINENHIFREVFFGHEKMDGISKKYDVTGAINFENDKKIPKDISFCSDCGSSVMTNQEDFQNIKEDSGQGGVSEDFALFMRNTPDVEVKRRKMSPEEHFETKSCPEKVVNSSVSSIAVNFNSNDQKTYDVSKAIPPPVKVSKKRWKDSSFIELDKDELLIPPKESATNPKPILRYYTYCLLKAAGWLIGRRNRKGRGEYIFKTPEGRPIRQFHRSWNMCGQRLVKDARFIEFKIHAGFSMKRSCLNLFMESGKSFTLCQLEAWSTEYKVRKGTKRVVQWDEIDQSDDSCGLCGDGGELICCDNCLSTFHQACLSTQELPEGNWYCLMCCCSRCGDVVSQIQASDSNALKCLQCERKYHEECIKDNRIEKVLVGPTWFCGETCEKIHSSLDSQIGCMNPLSDGYSWTLLRCIQGDQKVHSGQDFVALKAECNLKLAVALTIMEECFLPMVDTRTGIHMLPHVVYNWGSEYTRLNYEGFYTVVLEKDDILLCVASLRIHGATVSEVPLIATCSRYRRQGMCRRLMNAIEEMLKSFKVEKLVVSAIPSLVETWTHGFGFTPLEADEKKSLDKTNLMVFPGTVWLKKPMYQGSTQSTHFLGTSIEAVSSDMNCELEESASLVDTMPVYDTAFLQELETVMISW
ncbi:hypothetical protein L1987_84603 [Smallanthus sonchifolius]|uniref:Uncharacterized protein n=1 Tax=Smallanthus sonchifolius TaxID=185202 RepID=A0ACB8XV09_9ASTR|nr:hypothetical protein L1987_84603 [Smallanthus sonchifolius]